jgi:hypothetical protein
MYITPRILWQGSFKHLLNSSFLRTYLNPCLIEGYAIHETVRLGIGHARPDFSFMPLRQHYRLGSIGQGLRACANRLRRTWRAPTTNFSRLQKYREFSCFRPSCAVTSLRTNHYGHTSYVSLGKNCPRLVFFKHRSIVLQFLR